ncbi:MAG TPA: DegT/DnrJ/EryC1/StrS family aminotransferase [Solirubrobacteraceae bacterium]|nr:DegT/DnrJ/EryC1/StrS family aminotransferase [Solirubrobacteraceae bacterium]
MSAQFLPYGRQEITEQDIEAVAAALRRPMITQGETVPAFEAAFADAVGARHAVAFASGTGALHAAAVAAGLGPGDTMLTTPVSFVASANCALFAGARPRFADIDASGNLDTAAAVAAGLADDVRAVLAVSLAGLPVDLEPLQPLRERGVLVIEDGCHALGGRRASEPVGGSGLADMTCFSLHPVKSMTTGEGGVVTTNDAGLASALATFRTHGMVRRSEPDDPLLGAWHYDIDALGFNYRITDFQCALGLSQLERLPAWVGERNRVAASYRELLAGVDGLTLPEQAGPGELHGHHLFVVRFTEGARRRRFMFERLREAGIGTQLHYIPIPCHGLYRELGYGGAMGHLPQAQAYYEQALSLPMFPAMTVDDVARVVGELRHLLAESPA